MISFFQNSENKSIIAVQSESALSTETIKKLTWLFSNSQYLDKTSIDGYFIGPRREMITPWSTNAVEITQNMGISGLKRIEEYFITKKANAEHDPMLQRNYSGLNQKIFDIDKQPDPIIYIDDIVSYNQKEGLALNENEIKYLNEISEKIGRKLTDSEEIGRAHV